MAALPNPFNLAKRYYLMALANNPPENLALLYCEEFGPDHISKCCCISLIWKDISLSRCHNVINHECVCTRRTVANKIHKCTCSRNQEYCRADTAHECSCSINPEYCKAVSNHECISNFHEMPSFLCRSEKHNFRLCRSRKEHY